MSDTTPLTKTGFRSLLDKIDAGQRKLNERRDKVLSRCPHKGDLSILIYHADPSGNNDSWYECPICRRAVDRQERAAITAALAKLKAEGEVAGA